MGALKILIIDANLVSANEIKNTIEDAGNLVIGIARDFSETMRLIKTNPPDLAIIDISLGKQTEGGIAIAQEILSQHWMPFIYLTSNSDAGIVERAQKTSPSAFLLKPFRPKELLIQIALAYSNFTNQNNLISNKINTSFYLPLNNGHERIIAEEILYFEAKGACVNIHLTNRKNPDMIGMNLGNLSQYFTSSNFFRLSRSLFINLDHLKRIERTHIYLGENKATVEISEANRKELLKRLQVIRTK